MFFYLVALKPLSLRSGLFLSYMLGQHYSLYFESIFFFKYIYIYIYIYNKKGGGGLKGCRGLSVHNFQISYVCLTVVSIFDAFIHFPLYN
jgi:hypothetical protein